MNSKTKETLLSNRVKIMKLCDYFIVSAPLIAKRILSLEKHKEYKLMGGNISDSKAANNARMDALLEFLDECNTPGAFDAFLEGIKNCEGQKSFAKTLKKEAEGTAGPPKPGSKPKLGGAMKKPKSPTTPMNAAAPKKRPPAKAGGAKTTPIVPGFSWFNAGVAGMPGGPPQVSIGGPLPPPKAGKKANPPEGGKRALAQKPPVKKPVVPLPPMPPPPPGLAQILASIARGNIAPAPPTTTPAAKPTTPSTKPTATTTPAAKQTPQASGKTPQAKIAPRPSPGPSTSSAAAVSAAGFIAKIPAGSPFKPKDGLKRGAAAATPKSKPMTFQEVETKQKGASRATTFSFLSPAAVVKTIHFNNKSDLFYEGCPSKVGGTWCAKKVQLKGKGKKYVCKEKHENESYNLFPRLYVTFEDGTTHIQTVLYRENVEILAQMKLHDMQTANDEQLKAAFFRAHRKNIPIEVKCKKIAQKDLKKSDGATWDNIATIVLDAEEGSSAKRGRKSVD